MVLLQGPTKTLQPKLFFLSHEPKRRRKLASTKIAKRSLTGTKPTYDGKKRETSFGKYVGCKHRPESMYHGFFFMLVMLNYKKRREKKGKKERKKKKKRGRRREKRREKIR